MGALSLPDAGSVYVDANTVIYAVERIEPYRTLLEPLWQAAQQQRISLATSELTWLETLAKPLRDNNRQLEALFRAFLTSQDDAHSGDAPDVGTRSTSPWIRIEDAGRPACCGSGSDWLSSVRYK